MFYVKYKLYATQSTLLCLIERGNQTAFFSKFSTTIAFNNNDFPRCEHLETSTPSTPTQLTVSKVLHFISKTLETVNVSQESHSFKPFTKAKIDFVEISVLLLMRFDSLSECVKYWVKKQPHRREKETRRASASLQCC